MLQNSSYKKEKKNFLIFIYWSLDGWNERDTFFVYTIFF